MNLSRRIVLSVFTLALLTQGRMMAFEFKKPTVDIAKVTKQIQVDYSEYNISDEKWLQLEKFYKGISKDRSVIIALELLGSTVGSYSRDAVLGFNLTEKKIKIDFKDLREINPSFENYDAAGSKVGSKLYININRKHADAPPVALAALLAHEALHQDPYNSVNEETYAWTMEAAVWHQLSETYPKQADSYHPLVQREDLLKKMFVKGNYSDKYIRKSIVANPAYKNLPSRSPGFDEKL